MTSVATDDAQHTAAQTATATGDETKPPDIAALPFQITEDPVPPSAYGGGVTLLGNESSPFKFDLSLALYARPLQQGALIGVGTFRALILAASSKQINRVILMDYDRETTQFNQAHLLAIAAIARQQILTKYKRLQYLGMLGGVWLDPIALEEKLKTEKAAELGQLRAALSTNDFSHLPSKYHGWGEPLPREDLEQMKTTLEVEEEPSFAKLFATAQEMILKREEGDGSVLIPLAAAPREAQNFLRAYPHLMLHAVRTTLLDGLLKIYSVRDTFFKRDRSDFYYWNDDSSWDTLQSLILRGRVHAINGDLSGDFALKSIAASLKQEGEQLLAMDISNSLDYWEGGDRRTKIKKFTETVQSFPGAETSLLLWTHIRPRTDPAGFYTDVGFSQSWVYNLSPWPIALRTLTPL